MNVLAPEWLEKNQSLFGLINIDIWLVLAGMAI